METLTGIAIGIMSIVGSEGLVALPLWLSLLVKFAERSKP